MRIKILLFVSLILLASCKNGPTSSSSEGEEWPDHLQFSHNSGFYDEPFLLSIEAPKGYELANVDNSAVIKLDRKGYAKGSATIINQTKKLEGSTAQAELIIEILKLYFSTTKIF